MVLGNTNLIRALGLAGVQSVAVARRDSPMAQSRFVVERIEWADNWGDPEGLTRNLLAYARRCPQPPALFYQHDGDLAFVSRNRDELSEHLRFVVADAELVEDLLDKTRFTALAERLGLPVPRSVVLDPSADAEPPELPFGYPAIVKPLTRVDRVWRPMAGHHKAIRVGSARELRELWPRFRECGGGFVAQELIAGGEQRIESYHVYVDAGGEVAGDFTGRKVRTSPREFGETTALTITDAADVRAAGRDCVAALGLRGVAKLDFKRAPDGRLYLLEVNPRFNLWHLPGAIAGVNLPALVYADLVGEPRPLLPSRPREGVGWSVPWDDLRACRENGVPLRRWAGWQVRCQTHHIMALDDPMPFVRGLAWRHLKQRVVTRH